MTITSEHREERNDRDISAVEASGPKSSLAWLAYGCGTAADRRNQLILVGWIFAWMVVYTLAAQTLQGNLTGIGFEVDGSTAWVVALLPNALALVVLFAYLRLLRETDELVRLIQLQAFAVGFGAFFFLSMGQQLFEHTGAAPLADDWQLLIPVAAMVIGQIGGAWRYR